MYVKPLRSGRFIAASDIPRQSRSAREPEALEFDETFHAARKGDAEYPQREESQLKFEPAAELDFELREDRIQPVDAFDGGQQRIGRDVLLLQDRPGPVRLPCPEKEMLDIPGVHDRDGQREHEEKPSRKFEQKAVLAEASELGRLDHGPEQRHDDAYEDVMEFFLRFDVLNVRHEFTGWIPCLLFRPVGDGAGFGMPFIRGS